MEEFIIIKIFAMEAITIIIMGRILEKMETIATTTATMVIIIR